MAHIGLEHFEMKPRAVVKFEITREHRNAITMLFVSAIASLAIIGVAALFLSIGT